MAQIAVDPDVHVLSKNNSSTLSVASAFAKANLFIYPNPATGIFNIETSHQIVGLKIHDLQGRLINDFVIHNQEMSFPTPAKTGVYLITMTTNSNVFYERLVVN